MPSHDKNFKTFIKAIRYCEQTFFIPITGKQYLSAAITLPEQTKSKPVPGVLFCHGFTGNRIETRRLFVLLSRQLAQAGIASLRFDYRGSGESSGNFEDFAVLEYIADAMEALQWLQKNAKIDRKRIGVLGFSLGGCVASYLAGKVPEALKVLVLWAPVASGKAVFEHIYHKRLTQHHYTLESRKPFIIDLEGFPVSSKFLRNLVRLKPVNQLKQVNCAVLICQGSADDIVPVSQAEEYFNSLKRWYKQVQLHIISGATHSFNSLLHIKELLDKTTDWFRQHL